MSKLLGLLGGWQGYVAAALGSALLAGIVASYLTALPYRMTISNMKREQAEQASASSEAALKQFQQTAQNITDAANAFQGVQAGLDARFTSISQDFAHAIKARPLSPDCKPDDIRLRSLSASVAAANSATGRQPIPAVSQPH